MDPNHYQPIKSLHHAHPILSTSLDRGGVIPKSITPFGGNDPPSSRVSPSYGGPGMKAVAEEITTIDFLDDIKKEETLDFQNQWHNNSPNDAHNIEDPQQVEQRDKTMAIIQEEGPNLDKYYTIDPEYINNKTAREIFRFRCPKCRINFVIPLSYNEKCKIFMCSESSCDFPFKEKDMVEYISYTTNLKETFIFLVKKLHVELEL